MIMYVLECQLFFYEFEKRKANFAFQFSISKKTKINTELNKENKFSFNKKKWKFETNF